MREGLGEVRARGLEGGGCMHSGGPVVLLLAACEFALASTPTLPITSVLPTIDTSVLCDGATARERFNEYERMLEGDPQRFASELATLRRLEASDVTYVIRICRFDVDGVEGSLTTDGDRIFVNVSDKGGAAGEIASLNSRIAHELEHARQFNDGEVAFLRDPRSAEWCPAYTSYDIGDEVKAWAVQLNCSVPRDHWLQTVRGRQPTLLHEFGRAATDAERAQVLVQHGYRNRRQLLEVNVVFPASLGFVAGQLVRPDATRNFFGRVKAVSNNSGS